MSNVRSWILSKVDNVREAGDELITTCVSCGKEDHMYINATSGLAHCFKCGFGANFVQLVSAYSGIDKFEARKIVKSLMHMKEPPKGLPFIVKNSIDVMNFVSQQLTPKVSNDEIAARMLPENTVALFDPSLPHGSDTWRVIAIGYLKHRGVSEKVMREYCLMVSVHSNCLYVTFPDYTKGRLTYWAGRCIDVVVGSNQQVHKMTDLNDPKSMHPKGIPGPYVFGRSFLRRPKEVILVEGPMDMLALPGYACATLGKTISKENKKQIAVSFDKITIAFDADAFDDAAKLADDLLLYGAKHVRVFWKYPRLCSDPADMMYAMPTPKRIAIVLTKSCRVERSPKTLSGLYIPRK